MDELRKIIFPIEGELNNFENKLREIINKDDTFLKDSLNEFVFSSPKRLRPIFIYLFSKILKIENKCIENIALSIELIHNASLVHDDILDEETKRRGVRTFYDKFGEKIAVLQGDLLLSYALLELSNTSKEIMKIFSIQIQNTILGELIQNSSLNKVQNFDTYIEKTLNKTGSLFVAGIESLFTLKGYKPQLREKLISFMKNYSIAFQIKNDIENIKSTNSSDIQCGNYTLPVIYFCLDNNADVDIDSFNKVKEKYINKSLKTVEEYKNSALKDIEGIENSLYKDSVIRLCKYTL